LYAITVSAIGITVTRLFLSQLLKRLSAIIVVFFSMAVVVIGAIALQYSTSLIMGLASTAVMGAGIASSFPVMLGYTASAFPRNSGTAFSIVIGIALIGNMLLSSFTGFVLDVFGIGRLNLLLIAFIIIMTGILSIVKYKLLKI
jgi:MFS family permease